ncbi:RhoGAP-domain-containing protein [Anaeromyces robustus]|uniref:RhoGAP-domain-containing protein n=1 Tax=Anaeromyces robustus TaxID=1754192 RepID=A0A1Y1X5S4_9FUNG|nr:RhoGAP-domain-containing protein [Anaeromyces robustus]|eukprot:ORX81159.1 RhoGAP-domain-containing protein [Anaeromyces robustus]
MYDIGGDNASIKSSKFSKLTNSAKKIIKSSSNKKLFKDKKTRSRGFSVTLPVKPIIDDHREERRRNSIIESSMSITNEVIPHVFISHSYIKPTKCEICQELCWRKEIRCKTCGFRCHERCQAQAEKITSCIVNKVQKANMISELESQKKLFGTTISTYGINEIDFIPAIVKSCINEVEKRGLDVEGIYRKSGNVIKTRNLVKAYDCGDIPDISENGDFPDIPVITSTLKQYFRDLPEALIPERFFETIKEIIDMDDEIEQVHQIKTLVIEKLPKINYETLKFLCIHLNNVDAHSDKNLMTSKNLGVVFGPTLIGEAKKTENSQNNMISTVCRVRTVDLIIRCAKEIFDYNSDEEKNHINMAMINDIENTVNEKQTTNNAFDNVDTNNKNSNKSDRNAIDVGPIAQL